MKTHFDYINELVNLKNKKVLDLGSGRGDFLIDCAKNNVDAKGLELSENYIKTSIEKANSHNLKINIEQGVGEDLPFDKNSFDFVNLCEVIEHVNSPTQVLGEVYRVMKNGGSVYMSVPNRFGLKDQHFDLYFVNFLPRSLSKWFINLMGKSKTYASDIGYQELDEMHYFTYRKIKKICEEQGFKVIDSRLRKLKSRPYLIPLYLFLKHWYFDSFHLILIK